jgi:hypothetical protein
MNGVEVPVTTVTGAATSVFNSNTITYIGRDANGAGFFLDGRLGKQILWNGAALTPAQHSQVFNILRTDYGI